MIVPYDEYIYQRAATLIKYRDDCVFFGTGAQDALAQAKIDYYTLVITEKREKGKQKIIDIIKEIPRQLVKIEHIWELVDAGFTTEEIRGIIINNNFKDCCNYVIERDENED